MTTRMIETKRNENLDINSVANELEEQFGKIFDKVENELGFSGDENLKALNEFLGDNTIAVLDRSKVPIHIKGSFYKYPVNPFIYEDNLYFYDNRKIKCVNILNIKKYPVIDKLTTVDSDILDGCLEKLGKDNSSMITLYGGKIYVKMYGNQRWGIYSYDLKTKTLEKKIETEYSENCSVTHCLSRIWMSKENKSPKIYDLKTETQKEIKLPWRFEVLDGSYVYMNDIVTKGVRDRIESKWFNMTTSTVSFSPVGKYVREIMGDYRYKDTPIFCISDWGTLQNFKTGESYQGFTLWTDERYGPLVSNNRVVWLSEQDGYKKSYTSIRFLEHTEPLVGENMSYWRDGGHYSHVFCEDGESRFVVDTNGGFMYFGSKMKG